MSIAATAVAVASRAAKIAGTLTRLARLDDETLERIAALGELAEQVDDLDGIVEHLTHHSGEIEVRVGNVEAVCSELYLGRPALSFSPSVSNEQGGGPHGHR